MSTCSCVRVAFLANPKHRTNVVHQAYRDSVNEVRVGASEGLQRLCKVCGADWLQEKVLPRIHGFYDESTFYLIRIAILNALKKLANGEVRSTGAKLSPTLEGQGFTGCSRCV